MLIFLNSVIMCSFTYGGNSYEALDYDVLSSSPRRSYTEGPKGFDNRAKEEMKELEPEDYKHPFITVYSESGYTYHTGIAQKALSLSLAGQDYIYTPSVKKVHFCNVLAVYFQSGHMYRQLWKISRFLPENRPVFLNREMLEKILGSIFSQLSIKLGQLSEKNIKYIAWEINTEKGIFYIPWHNGCLLEKTDGLEFEEKEFAEIKRTYKVLRFAACTGSEEAYRILCA